MNKDDRRDFDNFLRKFDAIVNAHVEHDSNIEAFKSVTKQCHGVDGYVTVGQIFNDISYQLFVNDMFIIDNYQRKNGVQQWTTEILCQTWTNTTARRIFTQPFANVHKPTSQPVYFTLESYLFCAGELHQASVNEELLITTTAKFYLAVQIISTIFAVLAVFLITTSAIGVFYANGLSWFRRGLLLNLCFADLANAWTICAGEHMNHAREDDGYYLGKPPKK